MSAVNQQQEQSKQDQIKKAANTVAAALRILWQVQDGKTERAARRTVRISSISTDPPSSTSHPQLDPS
jgi:hypothetical protein